MVGAAVIEESRCHASLPIIVGMRALAGVTFLALASAIATAQTPQPFPTPTQKPGGAATHARRHASTAKPAAPTPAAPDLGGLPMYPNAVYLASYDAGRGQRFHLYGVNLPYAEAVNFYRTALKQKGDELFPSPPTYQFDVGRFREQDMAYPPGVTIKDYTWGGSAGYVNPRGGQPERFPTVIQVVTAPAGAK